MQLPEAAQGALLCVPQQVPELDSVVCTPTGEHLPHSAVPQEGEDGVDVMRLARCAVLRLFALFLAHAHRFWDVHNCLLGITEDGIGINGVKKADGVDLNLWLESANGDIVYECEVGLSSMSMFSAVAIADETG